MQPRKGWIGPVIVFVSIHEVFVFVGISRTIDVTRTFLQSTGR